MAVPLAERIGILFRHDALIHAPSLNRAQKILVRKTLRHLSADARETSWWDTFSKDPEHPSAKLASLIRNITSVSQESVLRDIRSTAQNIRSPEDIFLMQQRYGLMYRSGTIYFTDWFRAQPFLQSYNQGVLVQVFCAAVSYAGNFPMALSMPDDPQQTTVDADGFERHSNYRLGEDNSLVLLARLSVSNMHTNGADPVLWKDRLASLDFFAVDKHFNSEVPANMPG